MGWKALKEHYRIGHIVSVSDHGVCIGSPLVSQIMVIGLDGKLVKRPDTVVNDDIIRYQQEIEANPDMVRRLLETPDTFSVSFPVYTFEGADIIEKRCEQLGWPNVTHDGRIMYENTFSTNREQVVRWAIENAEIGLRWAEENLAAMEDGLAKARVRLQAAEADVAKLLARDSANTRKQ